LCFKPNVGVPLATRVLTRRACVALSVAAGLALAGCDPAPVASKGKPVSFKGIDITGAPYGKGFALTDMHGQPRTLADFAGKVVMLYFGFVQCPDVCPTALARASLVMQQLGPELAAMVQVIFVTVDPERDTPELLHDYMAAFDVHFSGAARQCRANQGHSRCLQGVLQKSAHRQQLHHGPHGVELPVRPQGPTACGLAARANR
jgi:cytochrome oxidase Cu insertion factor (SCO1/SenC/PrrC family)